MTVPVDELIAAGRNALRNGDGAAARRHYEQALEADPSGDVLEGLARAAYLEHDYSEAIAALERAYAAPATAAITSARCATPAPSATCTDRSSGTAP